MGKQGISVRTDLVQCSIKPESDISGRRFGKWIVLRYAGTRNGHWFACRCDCGKEITVHGGELRMKRSLSCGHDGSTFKHGGKRRHGDQDRAYDTWVGMRSRCNNPTMPSYANYGGRGIRVCERWSEFPAFLADMGHPPSPEHSIDRINNDGNYEPSNCRWATAAVQRRNSRRVVLVTINGKTQCLKDWCLELGLSYGTVSERVRRGYDPFAALY